MPLRLNGSTSGYSQLDAPAIAGDQTFTLPGTGGTLTTTNGGQTIEHATGTASAPSVTFTGDTNTGIFSTGADAVGVTTGGTERMRINSAGRVTIGDAIGASDGILHVKASAIGEPIFHSYATNASFNNDVAVFSADRNTTNNSYNFLLCIRQNAAVALYIRDSGNVQNANNSYTGISDVKLKENIVDANSQWADIKALRVRNYNFKEETGHPTHKQIGLVAQEVEEICPQLVDEAPDRDFDGTDLGTTTKGVNYSVLYMKAVKALQEAMERIETLEASNADLVARITALEAAS